MKFVLQLLKPVLLVLLFLNMSSPLTAQSPYRLDGLKDGLLIGVPLGVQTFSFIHSRKFKGLTKAEVEMLRTQDVWAIDRWAIKQYPTGAKARKVSDFFLYSSFALPLSMLASDRGRNDVGAMGAFYVEALLITSALTDLTKGLVRRSRPLAYNEFVDINLKLEKGVRTSFFSGHTSTTAAMSFLTAKMYADFHPDSNLKPVVWTTAALIPAATGFLRMRGGKHFFTDVLVGFITGAAIGILVPEIHRIGD